MNQLTASSSSSDMSGSRGKHAAGLQVVLLYVLRSKYPVLPVQSAVEQADLYATLHNPGYIFQRSIPVRSGFPGCILTPGKEIVSLMESLVYKIPVDAVSSETVLTHEPSDFHVRKLRSAYLIIGTCSALSLQRLEREWFVPSVKLGVFIYDNV